MTVQKRAADLAVGDPVCIAGYGTANIVHEHGRVTRVSNLYVTAKITQSALGQGAAERRFRRDNGHSVPRADGGGTEVTAYCVKENPRP